MTEKPVAWLIRENRTSGGSTVTAGAMFKSREAAEAAAARMTNRWRTCVAFPVFDR